ncbi:MAG: hypothetical protein NC548_46250 [Lachnospiraceae bacterium]|nr:hypothetical protein [Lachnospiraceae bacterium]
MNDKEETRNAAICNLTDAESFVCLTLKDNKLDMASIVNPNTLGMMLLSVMRSRTDFANAVNYAALAYARENIIAFQPLTNGNQENQ